MTTEARTQAWAVPAATAQTNRARRAAAWCAARPWLLLPLLAIPALLPFWAGGLHRTIDSGLHLLRIASLDRALRAGTLLPRWQPEMLLGYGYPTLNYYAPASYYLVELLHLLGLSIDRAFMVVMAAFILAAGFGMYLLAVDLFHGRKAAALVAATAYMYAPYLLINIFNRGAIAEAGAQALLPWLLWSARALFTAEEPQRPALLLALLLAGLAAMHTISLLFVPPLLVAYMLVAGTQAKTLRPRAGWALGAILAAMGASAFFWLPLLFERAYLTERGFEIARQVWLPRSAWRWDNFIERSWVYSLTSYRPVRLGLMQAALAVAGFFLARRRDGEWLFWGAVALATGALIGAWSLPLWSSTILSVAQFPWRMLSILSLPLALFAGGIVAGPMRDALRRLLTAALLAAILFAQAPRLRDANLYPPASVRLDPSVMAMVDLDRGVLGGGEGDSMLQEFRPRWAARTLVLDAQPESDGIAPTVTVEAANAYDLLLAVSAPTPAPLRFTTFYFPGWEVRLDGQRLATRPSTNLGLLTVDLPAGEHSLHVTWAGTPLERAANWLSLATWAALAALCLARPGLRAWAILPAALAVVGLAGTLWSRPLETPQPPLQPYDAGGARLLAALVETANPAQATVRPFWQITQPVDEATRIHWQLQDQAGKVLSDYSARPYFNTSSTHEWAVGSVVDDAYLLPLPAGLPAGDYRLAVALVGDEAAPAEPLPPRFALRLEQPVPPDPQPTHTAAARFGNDVDLVGYALEVNGAPVSAETWPVVARPGDLVTVALHWRPARTIYDNLHAFVHIVDVNGAPLVQEDQSPGPMLLSPEQWLPGRTYQDLYRLRIPSWTAGGLYTPWVGVYPFDTVERLPVTQPGQDTAGDHAALPPIKVHAEPQHAPTQRGTLDVRIGDFATISAAEVAPAAAVRPGETITVTLAYRSDAPTSLDLTRFLHLHGGDLGMAAQADGTPQGRFNPTWAWVPGERIVEQVPLTVRPDARPGDYTLLLGFYDAHTGGRAALTADGAPLPDNALPIATVTVH